jgi:hypothetical protein
MLLPTVLYRGQPGDTSTTLYTVTDTSGKYAIVKNIFIHNASEDEQSIALHSVASGGSASDANKFFDGTLDAGKTVMIDASLVLVQNETLRAIAGAATSVTVIVSGVAN